MLAHYSVIPEMTHNEIVGWTEKDKYVYPIFIETLLASDKTKKRIKVSEKITSQYSHLIGCLFTDGDSILEQNIFLLQFVDWISFYVAKIKEIDPFPVDVIAEIKQAMVE